MNRSYTSPPRKARKMTTAELYLRLGKIILHYLYMPLSILYMELILRYSIYYDKHLTGLHFFYIFCFSFAFGWLVTFIASSFRRQINQIIHIVALSVLTVIFWVQYGYFHFFGAFFRWSTIGMATDVTDYAHEAFQMIKGNWFSFVLLVMPLLVYIFLMRPWAGKKPSSWSVRGILGAGALTLYILSVCVISAQTEYYGDFQHFTYLTPVESVERFGLLTETRQDFHELIFGVKEIEIDPSALTETVDNPFATKEPVTDPPTTNPVVTEPGSDTEPPYVPPKEYGYNVLDIDWDALIAGEKDKTIKDMHQYFSIQTPTKENEYTGMFEGKNLIMMTLEGYSYRVIELAPELFPLLRKMTYEGFYFTNYYVSMDGGSTASGEYANMTGMFYKDAKCFTKSEKTYMPFVLGNQFNKLGYTSMAFHNWRADYYDRNLSHPNFGYDYYAYDPNKALPKSNRLDFKAAGYIPATHSKDYYWPNSDWALADISLPYFIDKTPFNVYYMTVSGHATYSWGGNNMSKQHRDEVADLPYSETVKAYIACNLEVERMLERLCEELEEKGILEDTVFVMACDHYPYGLTYNAETDQYDKTYTQYLSELYGIPEKGIANNKDLYRNSLVIYCASMKEPVIVTEPCCAMDILPTVSNLFGLPYDSRLMIGTDILSDSENLVILNCDTGGSAWNWINRYGWYSTATKTFTPAPGVTMDESKIDAYVKQINTIVTAKKKYSWAILEKDYYKYLKSYIK